MSDAALMMQYDAHKKSAVIAYLLWFFLGILGAHRFYLAESGTGTAILVLTLASIVLMPTGIGLVTAIIPAFWVLIDLFLIPGIARRHNVELAARLNVTQRHDRDQDHP